LLGEEVTEEKPKDITPEVVIDRDDNLLKVCDRIIFHYKCILTTAFHGKIWGVDSVEWFFQSVNYNIKNWNASTLTLNFCWTWRHNLKSVILLFFDCIIVIRYICVHSNELRIERFNQVYLKFTIKVAFSFYNFLIHGITVAFDGLFFSDSWQDGVVSSNCLLIGLL